MLHNMPHIKMYGRHTTGCGHWRQADTQDSGNWKDDKRDGEGMYTFANGDKYIGHNTKMIKGMVRGYIHLLMERNSKACGKMVTLSSKFQAPEYFV